MQAIQRIRERTGGTLKLPQLCVVGDQSSGKSSLLDACTGIAFPESAGICTRAPAVVECHFDDSLEADEYKIEAETGVYRPCRDLDDLRTHILRAHDAALKKTQGPSFISTDEIRVKVRGPRQMDIIVVDLPGIIHNGEGAKETRELIRRYCEPHQTLMLLVSEAKQDEESIEAIALAKTYDKDGTRTLRVLTKFDTFDSDKARQRACGWVEAGSHSMLGCHALVCRSRGAEYNAREEASCLAGLPPDRSGVAALKRRLPPLFAELISRSLPDLQKEIIQKLQEAEQELRVLGDEPVGKSMMVFNFQRSVADREAFEKALAPHFIEFEDSVRKTEERVTREWTHAKFSPNPFRLAHFQGETAVMACMEEIVDTWWRSALDTFYEQICNVTESSMTPQAECLKDGLQQPAATLSKGFRETVEAEWLVFCQAILTRNFNEELKQVLERERGFGTHNHYLDSKYEEQLVLPDDLLEKLAETFQFKNANLVREILQKHRSAWVAEHGRLDLQDQQKCRVLHAVKALQAVEAKTFVDNVLKVTRDTVVGVRAQWLLHDLPSNQKVVEMAVEDRDTAARRVAAKQQKASMHDCQQELQRLRCS